jgi:hypothetical protein
MYMSNDLVDCVTLEPGKISLPGYVGSFTRMLKEKHYSLIGKGPDEPQFLIQRFPDEANFDARL